LVAGARAQGTLRLSADADPALFELARVGLGALGVVAEVTLHACPRTSCWSTHS